MNTLKKTGWLGLAICAVLALSGSAASAATFTASQTGELAGWDGGEHIITTNAGSISCITSDPSGPLNSLASAELHVTVKYSNCNAFGFTNVHLSPATFVFTANGAVHLTNTFTVTVTKALFNAECTMTFKPQSFSFAFYSNNGSSELKVVIGGLFLEYTSSGGVCGSSGTASYEGNFFLWRVGGGSLRYDS